MDVSESIKTTNWFRKSFDELSAIFKRCDWSWDAIAKVIVEVRDGDFCEGKSLRNGWECYVERSGSKTCPVTLCAHLAQSALRAAKELSPPSQEEVRQDGWNISSKDAADILASAFWGNLLDAMALQKDSRNRGGLSFARIYDGYSLAAEKWACLWNYFDMVQDMEEVQICFRLVAGKEEESFRSFALDTSDHQGLCVNVHTGDMQDVEHDSLMNFANRNFGYGKVIESATQEEVLQVCFPEFNVGMLVFGKLSDNEVVVVHNVRRFSIFADGRFKGKAPATRPINVLTADACLADHFSQSNNVRDLQKAYLSFQHAQVISSGRWGCGAFGGDCQHKLLQQIIAARLARIQTIHFSTYHDDQLKASCDDVVSLCAARTLDELLAALWAYSEIVRVDRPPLSTARPHITVAQYLQLSHISPGDQPRCVLLSHGSFNPVHLHHTEMMTRAKAAAEAAGFTVVKSILACTSQGYLESKLGGDRIEQSVRMQALDAAIASHSWLEVDRRGMTCSSGQNMLRYTILPELSAIGEVVGFNVTGADAASLRKHGLPCIFVDRGMDKISQSKLAELNKERDVPHLHVQQLASEGLSSTAVRASLRAGQRDAVIDMCGPAVAEVLWCARQSDCLWPVSAWPCAHRRSRVRSDCVLA